LTLIIEWLLACDRFSKFSFKEHFAFFLFRSPSKQSSKPIFLSRCRLYKIEVFMTEQELDDHLSVGIKFPNGQEQKPMDATNLFWLKPG